MMHDQIFWDKWSRLDRSGQVNALGSALGSHLLQHLEAIDTSAWGLGQVTDILQREALRLIEPMLPALGSKLLEIAGPAAEKAASIVRPAIAAELDKRIPAF